MKVCKTLTARLTQRPAGGSREGTMQQAAQIHIHPPQGGVAVVLSVCSLQNRFSSFILSSFIKEFNKDAFYSFYFVFEYLVKAG